MNFNREDGYPLHSAWKRIIPRQLNDVPWLADWVYGSETKEFVCKEWPWSFSTSFTWGRQQDSWRNCCDLFNNIRGSSPKMLTSFTQRRGNLRTNIEFTALHHYLVNVLPASSILWSSVWYIHPYPSFHQFCSPSCSWSCSPHGNNVACPHSQLFHRGIYSHLNRYHQGIRLIYYLTSNTLS
jgi:hypothetical protein